MLAYVQEGHAATGKVISVNKLRLDDWAPLTLRHAEVDPARIPLYPTRRLHKRTSGHLEATGTTATANESPKS